MNGDRVVLLESSGLLIVFATEFLARRRRLPSHRRFRSSASFIPNTAYPKHLLGPLRNTFAFQSLFAAIWSEYATTAELSQFQYNYSLRLLPTLRSRTGFYSDIFSRKSEQINWIKIRTITTLHTSTHIYEPENQAYEEKEQEKQYLLGLGRVWASISNSLINLLTLLCVCAARLPRRISD